MALRRSTIMGWPLRGVGRAAGGPSTSQSVGVPAFFSSTSSLQININDKNREKYLPQSRRFYAQSYEHAPEWELEPEIVSNKRQLKPLRAVTADKWQYYNKVVWPPHCVVDEQGTPKQGELFHFKENFKYSPKKMWTVCEFVRGRNVDAAISQLAYVPRKGAVFMKEVLEEARDLAADHNIEFPSQLYVAEAWPMKGQIVKGFRRGKGGRGAIIDYRYCHIFVRLQEGEPQKSDKTVKYPSELEDTGFDKMDDYIKYLRSRTINRAL